MTTNNENEEKCFLGKQLLLQKYFHPLQIFLFSSVPTHILNSLKQKHLIEIDFSN